MPEHSVRDCFDKNYTPNGRKACYRFDIKRKLKLELGVDDISDDHVIVIIDKEGIIFERYVFEYPGC